jgi:hypothetical protein
VGCPARTGAAGKNAFFGAILIYINAIDLPRQARDKHRAS